MFYWILIIACHWSVHWSVHLHQPTFTDLLHSYAYKCKLEAAENQTNNGSVSYGWMRVALAMSCAGYIIAVTLAEAVGVERGCTTRAGEVGCNGWSLCYARVVRCEQRVLFVQLHREQGIAQVNVNDVEELREKVMSSLSYKQDWRAREPKLKKVYSHNPTGIWKPRPYSPCI